MNTDVDTLARTLYGEAKAGDVEDATAIAATIMNRVAYPNWPNDVSAVCLQPYQFSCWNVSDPNRLRIMNANVKEPWFRQCHEIAVKTIARQIPDQTDRATHYYAKTMKKAPKWAKGKAPCHQTAGHLFFNDIDTKPPKTAREALDQSRPLSSTRTVKGAQAATAGIGGGAVVEALQQASQGIEPLVPYLDTLKWVFIALALAGVGVTVYARWRDREKGRR